MGSGWSVIAAICRLRRRWFEDDGELARIPRFGELAS